MELKEHISLEPYTTFYIGGPSRYLVFAQTNEEVIEAVHFAQQNKLPVLVMGGGSNLLVADSGFDGLTIRVETVGIDIVRETDSEVVLKLASGEVWDDVVRFAVEENWWGTENLSHIPGFCGAFAVQNVGAYGQEASQVIESVEVVDKQNNQIKTFLASDLDFGYRKSIFNTSAKGRCIILSTNIKLSKIPQPNLSYGDLAERFTGFTPSIQEIRQAIIEIRDQKFPFPNERSKGNAGSFFRGKILSEAEFSDLKTKLSNQFGEQVNGRLEQMSARLKVPQGYKTPTAFLIEQCVGKELTVGGASLNFSQPTIILNSSGQASSEDVINLFKQVQDSVEVMSGVSLEAEPELIGFPREVIAGCKFDII